MASKSVILAYLSAELARWGESKRRFCGRFCGASEKGGGVAVGGLREEAWRD